MTKLRHTVFLPTLGLWVVVVVLPLRSQPSGLEGTGALGGLADLGGQPTNSPESIQPGTGSHWPCMLKVLRQSHAL